MKCRIGSPKLIYVWIQIFSVWFVWELLFVIWSILDLLGCNVNRMAIFCVFIIVSLIAVIVTHSFYKHIEYKKEKERFRLFLTSESKRIKNVVAKILSLGGVCAQTDADGWREYKLIEWKYEPKCYVKNVDGCKTLVICPIESAISVEQMVTVRRIVTEQKVGVLNADVVVASDLRGYIELCLDMSDIIFAQPYYHCISLGVASTYIPVMNFLKGRECIDNNADTTTDSENMEDVVFRKEDILY